MTDFVEVTLHSEAIYPKECDESERELFERLKKLKGKAMKEIFGPKQDKDWEICHFIFRLFLLHLKVNQHYI